jgi:hypothetical protein
VFAVGPVGAADAPAEIIPEGPPIPTYSPDPKWNFGVGVISELFGSKIDIPTYNSALSNGPLKVEHRTESLDFDDNIVENGGFVFIPPDPIGAAGGSRLVAVVNTMIECRNKGGKLRWRSGLANFFAPLAPTTFTFDPKIVYDHYAGRFVVVTLEQVTGAATIDPGNISRILLAVSNDDSPKSSGPDDWTFHAINAKTVIAAPAPPRERWADYPGFEIDEEAIYITANMYSFVPFGLFGGVRLWIVDKGLGTGGLYDGGPAAVAIHDPYAGGGIATTTMPALVHGDGGVGGPGSTLGTFLVSYSGLSDGLNEYIQVVTVDDPLGASGGPTFVQEFVPVGNIEDFPPGGLPDAPQFGIATLIEVNDRRALDAVWRDDGLWLTTTILPNGGPDMNQTTAHWHRLDTSGGPGAITSADQGDLGGEDIAPGTYTYFPAVAVNDLGEALFGFSASAPSVYAGAYAAGRRSGDPAGTVQASVTIHAGVDYYKRTFSANPAARNRWGDYSGICVDPVESDKFWVFNEYAAPRGFATNPGPEDGTWGTAWARVKFLGDDAMVAELLPASTSEARIGLPAASPNPFPASTRLSYEVPARGGAVKLAVYDVTGRRVKTLVDEVQAPGARAVDWDGTDERGRAVSSGVYLAHLEAAGEARVLRLLLAR